MSKKTAKTDETKAVLEKVTKLVALTESESEEEARTAAYQAVRMMKDNDLVIVPRETLEHFKSSVNGGLKAAEKERTKHIVMGAALGYLASSSGFLKGMR